MSKRSTMMLRWQAALPPITATAAWTAAALVLSACTPVQPARTATPPPSPVATAGATPTPQASLLTQITQNDDLRIFAQAIRQADLADAFDRSGPFTVFAPTDAAFNALPPALRDEIFAIDASGNRPVLRGVLAYHLAPGEFDVETLEEMSALQTAQGESITISATQLSNTFVQVQLNAAQLVRRNIQGANGVLHVVDAVLLPPSVQARYDAALRVADAEARLRVPNLLEAAVSDGGMRTFVEAVRIAGLTDALRLGDYTVLAPSDLAFARLPIELRENLLDGENVDQLRGILANHLITGTHTLTDVRAATVLTTVQGITLTVETRTTSDAITTTVGGVRVVSYTLARNGSLLMMDDVLLPPPPSPAPDAPAQ